jgi:predicted dehydrogenase
VDNPLDHVGPLGHEVGVAVVGAGYWGPNLVRNFLGCDSTWLWSVCDRDLPRARKVVGRYTSIRVTDDFDEVLHDPRIEAVAIATPTSTHHDLALRAIEAGKHILIEKPLAASLREAQEIVAAADERRVVVMCDHTFCFTPAVQHIRAQLAAGALGTVQYVDSVRINLGIVQPDTNVFWDLLPHDLSILDSVFPGGFAPKAVSAVGVDPIGAGHACVGYVTMVMPDDAIVHVQVSWLSPVKIRTVVFGGSRRHIVWDDTNPTQRISVYERGIDIARLRDSDDQRARMVQYRTGDMYAPALTETEALQAVVREFARCVRTGETPLTDGRSGLRVLRVLEAVDESIRNDGVLTPLGDRAAAS